MHTTLLIGLGSALGGMARYGVALLFEQWFGKSFPWGTLFINVTGSFAIGLYFALTDEKIGRFPVDPGWRLFVTVGVCGGFTTFSSFSLQTLALLERGEWLLAGWNVLGSLALCLLAVWLGVACAAAFNARP